ncbi:4Fe-4S binding protein [Denitrobacterium detoxificans]|uniref:4Fe-4S binding protein n=1 Tax=Denitrobacterium detoxificans TaxID=79604 RepID=UPI0026F2E886|nr:4Fe-4S binding protein [Denitrobacterium detoxificans]
MSSEDATPNAEPDDRSPGLSRRAFMVGAAGAAAMIAVGGGVKAFAGENEFVFPPGGQTSQLVGSCIRCDRCRSACPQNAISLGHLENGLLSVRLPIMKYSLGWCDFCDGEDGFRCVKSCPTGALVPGFDPHADKMGIAVFDYDECLLFRSGSRSCSKECRDACAYDAIKDTPDGGLEIIADLCNGCGACEYECPSAKYTAYDGSNRRGVNVEVWKG